MVEHIEPPVPPVGGEVDESFTVDLPAALEGPHIVIPANGAVVRLSRTQVEALAAGTPAAWKTEGERMALIRGGRAKGLLARVAAVNDGPLPAAELRDDAHLVGWLIETGQAVVVPDDTGEPARQIVVHYVGSHPAPMMGSGFIEFVLERPRRAFLGVSWFVA